MDKSRIVVILLLILIAVLFAVGIGAGFFDKDAGSVPKDERALKEVPGFVKGLGSLLSGLGAKLEVEDLVDVHGPITIRAGTPLVTHLRASDDAEYRKATFRLIDTGESAGRVEIRYQTDCLPPGLESKGESERNPKDQKLELAYPVPRVEDKDLCNDEDKACGKLNIFKCGGMLTLTCIGASSCQVELRK